MWSVSRKSDEAGQAGQREEVAGVTSMMVAGGNAAARHDIVVDGLASFPWMWPWCTLNRAF